MSAYSIQIDWDSNTSEHEGIDYQTESVKVDFYQRNDLEQEATCMMLKHLLISVN